MAYPSEEKKALEKAMKLKDKIADLLGRMQSYAQSDGPFVDQEEYKRYRVDAMVYQDWIKGTDQSWIDRDRLADMAWKQKWNRQWKRYNPNMSGIPSKSQDKYYRIPHEEKTSTWTI